MLIASWIVLIISLLLRCAWRVFNNAVLETGLCIAAERAKEMYRMVSNFFSLNRMNR